MGAWRETLWPLFLHLRLNWQVILLPIFLWGFFLSEGGFSLQFWLALFLFHIPFYGGATAFNSYYDQDEGPIGGLWNPPRAGRTVLWFSVAIQVAGLAVVYFCIGLPVFLVSVAMGALSAAYSHPAVRLKARPWSSLLAVSLGQGVGAAVVGWLVGRPDWTTLLSWKAVLGFATSSLVTTGFYPLTQVYQRAEDLRRGDNTFAVRFGTRVFPFALGCLGTAAALGGYLLWRWYTPWDAALLVGGLAAFSGLVYRWWRQFDERQLRRNFVQMMRLGYVLSLSFVGFIAWHLVRRA